MRNDHIKAVECQENFPYIRDEIIGDGNCFFRAVSKSVTGTQKNHKAFRKAIVNFMTLEENALKFV